MSSRLTIFRLQLANPPNPTTPNPLPLVLHKSSPCTNPFPNPHHPLVHRIPISCSLSVVPAACPVWLCQPRLAPAYTPVQAQCRSQVDGDLAPAPAPHCALAYFAIGGQQPQSRQHPSRATTGTSGANTNMHSMGMGSCDTPSMESPQYSGSGPRPPNGPGHAGARRLTYAHGPSMRVNPSLLSPSLWIGPSSPASFSRAGFPKIQQGPAQAQKRPPPPPPLQQQRYPPLSQARIFSTSSSTTTNRSRQHESRLWVYAR
jgi:hypothetical protein